MIEFIFLTLALGKIIWFGGFACVERGVHWGEKQELGGWKTGGGVFWGGGNLRGHLNISRNLTKSGVRVKKGVKNARTAWCILREKKGGWGGFFPVFGVFWGCGGCIGGLFSGFLGFLHVLGIDFGCGGVEKPIKLS